MPIVMGPARLEAGKGYYGCVLDRLLGEGGEVSAIPAILELLLWISGFGRGTRVEASDVPEGIAQARAIVEREFANAFSVDQLAVHATLSRSQFLRLFRKHYGVSPIELQQRLRIEAAMTLLKTTSLLSKEIAARIGFCDEYAFSRTFKKRTGMTVTRFRDRLADS
jgi:AraC-like DNA-binding protein